MVILIFWSFLKRENYGLIPKNQLQSFYVISKIIENMQYL